MNFYVGNQLKFGNHVYLQVEIGPQAETIEGLVRKILAALGLTDISLIENFNVFLGYDFFRSVINKASVDPTAKKAIKDSKGRRVKVPIDVYPEVIEELKRFGINLLTDSKGKVSFGGYNSNFEKNVAGLKKSEDNVISASQTPVEKMTTTEKVAETIRRAILLLPGDVGKELMALLDPKVLAFVVIVVVIWAASHFIGIGEIVDVIVIVLGIISLGPIAYVAAEHLINFATKSISADKTEDLDEAAKHISEAIALLGVQVVLELLLKKAPKVLKENPSFPSFKARNLPQTKRPLGEWFYKPTISEAADLGNGVLGATFKYGDIKYLSRLSGKAKDATILHEKVHRWLTPKFYPLRNFRVTLNWNSYAKSSILRYLEEALAQTVGQVGVYGFKQIFSGISFPVKNGYVTIAEMGIEMKGIFLGPLNAAGMTYRAYFTYSDAANE